jgi:hypothetical protein
VPNKIPREIKELAQVYTADGIQQLAAMAGLIPGLSGSTMDTARIAAIKELLDRGHGKAPQGVTIAGDDEGGPVKIEFAWASK